MKFRYTILYVENVRKSLEFYEKAFGLEIGFIHDAADYGELITGETKLAFSSRALMQELGKNTTAPAIKAPSFEIAFETDNVSEQFNRAVQAGATAIKSPEEMEWGQVISYVADIDGYHIEICSPIQGT